MKSNWMVMCFAAAVAIGCGDSDDNGNTGGSGGEGGAAATGGTGGSGAAGGTGGTGGVETPTNACLGDLELLEDIADTVLDTTTTCTLGACLLESDLAGCVGACVEEETGLSADCAFCFGLASLCVVENCTSECQADPESAECEACQVDADCGGTFEDCAGFEVPDPGTGGTGGMGGTPTPEI